MFLAGICKVWNKVYPFCDYSHNYTFYSLGGGAIAGIIIAVLVVLVIVCVLLFYCVKKPNSTKSHVELSNVNRGKGDVAYS